MGAWGTFGRLALVVATVAALVVAAAPAQAAPFAYVANLGGDQRIRYVTQYDAGVDGLLAPLSPPTVPEDDVPLGVAVSPDGKNVYVAAYLLFQYDVGSNGALSPKSPTTFPVGQGSGGVVVSPDGNSVYVSAWLGAGGGTGNVFQFDRGPGGALSPKSPRVVRASGGAWDLAVSPDGESLYVANSGRIDQYDIGHDGTLAPKSPASVPQRSPRDVVVSPDGRSVYAPDGLEGLFQYDVGPDGALSLKSPASLPLGNLPAAVAMTPDGDSVYVTNEWSNNVSQFDVGVGGLLAPKRPARVRTGIDPRDVAVSPTGESAYVTNRQDDNISQYNVGKDGGLSSKSPAAVATDDDPWSVALRPPPTSREQCKHDGWREFGFESKRECRHFVKRRARHICRAEREEIGRPAFREKYGKGKHHRRAVRRCVTRTVEA